jgi:hypothetical protein
MPIDAKRLEEITRLADIMQRGEDDLEVCGDLANAVPVLLHELERLRRKSRELIDSWGRASADKKACATELDDMMTGRYLERFGWSEEDFEGGGVTIK